MAFKIVSVLILASGLMMAQGRKGGGGNSNNMPDLPMSRPEPMDQLAQMLKLNHDQRKDVKGILDEAQKEVSPLRDSMAKSREQIGAVIEAGKSQDEIDQAVKNFSDLEAQVSAVEARAFTKIFSELEADQKASPQTLINTLMFMHEVFKRKNWNTQPSE